MSLKRRMNSKLWSAHTVEYYCKKKKKKKELNYQYVTAVAIGLKIIMVSERNQLTLSISFNLFSDLGKAK